MTQAFVEVITLQRWKKNSCLCNDPPGILEIKQNFHPNISVDVFFGNISIKQNNVMFE